MSEGEFRKSHGRQIMGILSHFNEAGPHLMNGWRNEKLNKVVCSVLSL